MSTLTLNLDDHLLHQAKTYAISQGTNLNEMIRNYLAEMTKKSDFAQIQTILKQYSEDKLGRKETMALLGVDYGELIVMMSENQWPLPSLPEPDIQEMAALFTKIWRAS